MIECQGLESAERYPLSVGRIISAPGKSAAAVHEKDHGGRRMARVPIRAGVDPHDRSGTSAQPRFLPQFPNDRFLDLLPELHKPAGERPSASEGGSSPTHEQDAAGTDPDGVHRERGVVEHG